MDVTIKRNCYKKQNLCLNYFTLGYGQPILFLHGVLFNALTYKKALKLLAKEYFVIAPDLPCFGDSFVPNNPYNFLDYAKILDEFISSLTIKSIVVIGHSFGGGIACYLTNINKQVSKLVLIDSAGIPLHESKRKLFSSIVKKTMIELILYNKIVTLYILRAFIQEFIIKHFFQIPLIFQTIYKCIYSSPKLKNIDKPTLILWGNKDEVLTCDYIKEFKKIISFSQTELIDGNHDWCLYYPEILHNKIKDFV